MNDTTERKWLVTRERLIEAIATMSLPGVPKWGAQSAAEWAERLADGIASQFGEPDEIPSLLLKFGSTQRWAPTRASSLKRRLAPAPQAATSERPLRVS